MNKYWLLTEAKPSVTTRLLHNNLHELKSVIVSVERKDVPQDVIAGSLARSLDNPEDLIIHRLGEGQKPIFDRNDVTANLDVEEKVIPTSELYKYVSLPIFEENQTENTRSRTSVEQRISYSTIEYLGTKPNSTPCEELGESEKKIKDCNKFPSKRETISISSENKPEDRKKAYSHKKEPQYQKSSERRNYRNDKYESDEGVHRNPSSYRSYKYNQIRNTFDRDYFQRPRENTPHLKNADYHRRGRFPYFQKRYELPTWRERGGFRNRFPLAHFHPQERYNPLFYQYHYCAPWLVYVPIPPYIQAVIPPPLPNLSQYVPMTRPRFSPS